MSLILKVLTVGLMGVRRLRTIVAEQTRDATWIRRRSLRSMLSTANVRVRTLNGSDLNVVTVRRG